VRTYPMCLQPGHSQTSFDSLNHFLAWITFLYYIMFLFSTCSVRLTPSSRLFLACHQQARPAHLTQALLCCARGELARSIGNTANMNVTQAIVLQYAEHRQQESLPRVHDAQLDLPPVVLRRLNFIMGWKYFPGGVSNKQTRSWTCCMSLIMPSASRDVADLKRRTRGTAAVVDVGSWRVLNFS
jgi:hypothetical protein